MGYTICRNVSVVREKYNSQQRPRLSLLDFLLNNYRENIRSGIITSHWRQLFSAVADLRN
jgi:hypothetical protein